MLIDSGTVFALVLFLAIASTFLWFHISSRDDKRLVGRFADKENCQITSSIRSTECLVEMLTLNMSSLTKEYARVIVERFTNFVRNNVVLPFEFLNDIWQPDDLSDSHPTPPAIHLLGILPRLTCTVIPLS